MRPIERCALSGVVLDDGNPLHRARMRRVWGRDRPVCLSVAHALDHDMRPRELEQFIETMHRREGFAP